MAGTDEKELQQLKKRLLELADQSYSRGIYTYTPFLSLAQQQVFYEIQKELSYAGTDLYGGAPSCERKMVRFGSAESLGYEEAYPIACLEMMPVMPKFADTLTHRDFLGAVMNHGIGIRQEIFLYKTEAVFCSAGRVSSRICLKI